MASSGEFKAQLEAFIQQQQKSLADLEISYSVERARLRAQIASAQAVVAQWDGRVDVLIDTLALAGVRIKTD